MLSSTSTKRGSGYCPECGEGYSTRWKPSSCSKCGFHLGGNQQSSGKKARRICPAAVLIIERGVDKIFSVQSSSRDDRCFVLQETFSSICTHKECLVVRATFVSSGRATEFKCKHTTSCTEAVAPQDLFLLDESAVRSYNGDTSTKEQILRLLRDNPGLPTVVQVSDVTYAVLGQTTTNNTLGYVHVKKLSDGSLLCCSKDTHCKSFVIW